jgi:hypothetical protein
MRYGKGNLAIALCSFTLGNRKIAARLEKPTEYIRGNTEKTELSAAHALQKR